MFFPKPNIPSQSDSKFDELRWVIQIRRTLEEELDQDDAEVPVCIFNVPKALLVSAPDSYIPQQVALGPYHYWRPELYEMQRYKLAAARRIQKQLLSRKYQNLVDQLTRLDQRIRACYHKYLDFNGETLAWMMAIDASFLLEFLQTYAIQEGKVLTRVSSSMSHLVDYAGRKSAHNVILRDVVMLENQIPLLVLGKILEFQLSSLDSSNDMLFSMLMGFCKEISPFKRMEDLPKIQVSQGSHLLDFLYQMIVPKVEEPSEITEAGDRDEGIEGKENSPTDSSYVKQALDGIWKLLSKTNGGPIRLIKKVLQSRAVKVILKLPWTILSNLPVFKIIKQPVEYFFSNKEVKPKDEASSSNDSISKPPSVEEISIPSVIELSTSGIRFLPTNGSISTIAFDAKTGTFYLPTISLDVNTEVVLRNLVAYEASNASGPLVFTRYTELMNGIIDTEEDVKALRESGILLNCLKSDAEVTNLWNGMSKSIRLTKVPFLDKVIEDVNKHHSGRWSVKVGDAFKLYVVGSWQFLALLAVIFLLLLMILQAFCSVYSCTRNNLPINTTT
ncbi:hypothetical protein I3843_02G137500 [Carya illinoinensis]|uniref:Uncharacterized protein n=1 Tax=Carya illinoinensis TaxID=32201 RepID=A0A922FWG9_CARIL|nr:hypothetical protein I3760_02G159500 [Carya illinoinensis]KAG6728112.1 hypothetical protein I3842_02G156900 [Carya illinoinensis]KAG7992662.1 hypothetical protein I3843_02G137500 [Carya illinoinensis]